MDKLLELLKSTEIALRFSNTWRLMDLMIVSSLGISR